MNAHKNKPGTIIQFYLKARSIKPVPGCSCYTLADEMDNVGPDSVEAAIDDWTDKMVSSIRQWRKLASGGWIKFIQPPRVVVRNLILWACVQSRLDA